MTIASEVDSGSRKENAEQELEPAHGELIHGDEHFEQDQETR